MNMPSSTAQLVRIVSRLDVAMPEAAEAILSITDETRRPSERNSSTIPSLIITTG